MAEVAVTVGLKTPFIIAITDGNIRTANPMTKGLNNG
jgi:hypothetical protein